MEQTPKPRELGYLLAISQIGFEMVVPIILGIVVDQWLGTIPWLMLVGVVLGLFGGLAHLVLLLRKMDRTDSKKPTEGST